MKASRRFQEIPGSICAPRGFKAAAVFCDIKRLGTGKGSEKGRKADLALILSDRAATVAGMFTTNKMRAAPVRWCAKIASKNFARAIVVNSGNANACTGAQGMRDAERMSALAADALHLKKTEMLVCSTGRIGVAMPMENVARGIRACASLLAHSVENARATAEAIMTSDTRRKEIAVEFKIGKVNVRIGGICKGAGMIAPKMTAKLHATMLAFITTDLAIAPALLKRALEIAVGQSFNSISVDGDMSTNDTVLVFANGAAGNKKMIYVSDVYQAVFQEALNHVCLRLAQMIVRDGEGVTRFVTIHVNGARSVTDAEIIARSITNSALVKTSWHGGDPNWGRILCAIGYAKAHADERKVDVGYSLPGSREILFGFRRGKPTDVPIMALAKLVQGSDFDVHVNLHTGSSRAKFYAADLTEDYVSFNKGDMSDPASLGG